MPVENRRLFGINVLVDGFTKNLIRIETLDGGWSSRYFDQESEKYWLEYVIDDRGFFRNLMLISPPPTTDELIDIAFTSPFDDEIHAAAVRLRLEEYAEKKEFRQAVIERLKNVNISELSNLEKNRLKTIIQSSQLIDKVNRREILGKHLSEIRQDAIFYEGLGDFAEGIFNKLKEGDLQ